MALIACAGCVPFKAYDLPRVAGVIEDSGTHEPIAGARILITSKQDLNVRQEAVSDELGHFNAPGKTHTIWLPPLPFDMMSPDCNIQVTARGYGDERFDYHDVLKAQNVHIIEDGPEFEMKRD